MSNTTVEPSNKVKTKKALDIIAGDILITFDKEYVTITDVSVKVSGIFEFIIAKYNGGFFCWNCEQIVNIKN